MALNVEEKANPTGKSPAAPDLLYQEIPLYYTWDNAVGKKYWKRRKDDSGNAKVCCVFDIENISR